MFLGTMLLGEPTGQEMFDLINERIVDFSLWKRLMLAMFFPGSEYFRPFQIVTHMFMHDGFMHIFFNMFALYMFGPPIETMWGSRRFLFYYLFVGLGAAALHLFVTYLEIQYGGVSPYRYNVPMLGASGAVFGLLAAFGMLFPNNVIQLLFPPIALKAKYFVLIYAGIELFMGLSRFNSGVAHFAHLGGALFGFLLILYWQKFGSKL
ncbi:MAG: rhomboid family intramembrane serine protease [Saprospiraceae bacterium]|nr:rhomboid family intramembrane serine protease [Saprospiraceae bacterium]